MSWRARISREKGLTGALSCRLAKSEAAFKAASRLPLPVDDREAL
jgi:hypothetical protein